MAKASHTALANTYVAVQKAAWDVPLEAVDALQGALERATQAARARWPGVVVEDDRFANWLADRAPDQTDPEKALANMQTDDLYLACACADADTAALRVFVEQILPAAAPAIARIDSNSEFVQSVSADVEIRLLVDGENGPARIRSYIGRGPLTSWVQVVATRLAYSSKRKKAPAQVVDADRLAALPFIGDDQELAKIRADFAVPFKDAFEASLRDLSPRDRNVLRLHLLEGVNTETVGRMYGVHRATVARWIASIHSTLTASTRKRLTHDLGLAQNEVDSMIRLLRSQLEVSIVSILT